MSFCLEINSQNKQKHIGLSHPMLEDYQALKGILISPENALCRLHPAERKRVIRLRIFLVITGLVVALLGLVNMIFVTPFIPHMKFLPVCVGFGLVIYVLLEFGMGRNLAMMGTVLTLSLVAGSQFALMSWMNSQKSPILYALFLLLLVMLGLRMTRGILTKARLERFSAVDTFARGEELRLARLKIPDRNQEVLFDAAVAFRPFFRCEEYYLRERVMLLMDFAKEHNLTFAGAYTTRDEPLVHYYLYGEDESAKKDIMAFFKSWRYGELQVDVRRETEYRTYYSLLPDESEFIRMYTELFLGGEQPGVKGEYSAVYSLSFPTGELTSRFMEKLDSGMREIAREESDMFRVAISERVEPMPRVMNERVQSLLTLAREYNGNLHGWRLYQKEENYKSVVK